MRLITILISLVAITANAETWQHYYSYNNLTQVVPTQSDVYCLSAGRLFTYHPADNTLTEWNTTTTLNSSEPINSITWNATTRQLVLAYDNGELDVVSTRDQSVVNIASIANQTTTLSKTVIATATGGNNVYLLTKERLIVLNTQQLELGDAVSFASDDPNFTDVWATTDSVYIKNATTMQSFGTSIIAACITDNLFDHDVWTPVSGQRATNVNQHITEKNNATDATTYVEDTYRSCFWKKDDDGNLMQYSKDDAGAYSPAWSSGVRPDGPSSNDFYTIYWKYNTLYTVSGGWRTEKDVTTPVAVQQYTPTGGWTTYEEPSADSISAWGIRYQAASDITIDPRNHSHVMVGMRTGLYEFLDGKFIKRWSKDNSPIKSMSDGTDVDYQMVLGTIYDSDGLLYVLNTMTSNALLYFNQTTVGGGSYSDWQHVPSSNIDNLTGYYSNPKIDSQGRLWFINLNWRDPALYSYHPQENALVKYSATSNQDGSTLFTTNTTSSYLRDLSIDADGNVWVAGTQGIAYLPASQIGTPTSTLYQHKVARNDDTGLADYLMSSVDCSCIIFDEAERMFVSTRGAGVYLISADGNEQLQHWTTDNSELMDDDVIYMALDATTGTLYLSTASGLCSVTTDAISVPSTLDKDNIKVYPNPVTPNYTGLINIDGLTVGADVKIVTASGYVVHEGYTTSARYQWDGCDKAGDRCASGIYNVLLYSPSGEEGTVAKIAIVR